MSGVVVLIGYILLIPSVLGVLFSALGFIRMVTLMPAAVTTPTIGQTSAELRKVLGEPTEVFNGGTKGEFFWYYGPKTGQTSYSFRDDKLAQIYPSPGSPPTTTTTTGAASMIASGIFIVFGVASLVGGLLGWLLVMKKDVLQCGHCGAVVAAS